MLFLLQMAALKSFILLKKIHNRPKSRVKDCDFKNFILGSIQKMKDLAQKEDENFGLNTNSTDNTTMQKMTSGRSR